MILQPQFFRKYVTRRVTDLGRLLPLNAITELPVGSVLTLMDNFQMDHPVIFAPDDKGTMYKLDPVRKFIYHVTEPNITSEAVIPIDMSGIVLPAAGVVMQLNKFRQRHQSLVKIALDIHELPKRTGVQSIINMNPMWRLRIYGLLRKHRIMVFILKNLINTLAQLPDRDHYIHIPAPSAYISNQDISGMFTEWNTVLCGLEDDTLGSGGLAISTDAYGSTEDYTKMDFVRAFKKIDKATIKYAEDPEYLFFMQLLCFIESSSNTSVFEHIPTSMLDKINFVITSKSNAVIYNLAKLKELNGDNNVILLRLINNINDIIRSNVVSATTFTTVGVNSDKEVDDAEEEKDGASDTIVTPTPTSISIFDLPKKMDDIDTKLAVMTGTLDVAVPDLLKLTVPVGDTKINAPAYIQPITKEEHQEFTSLEIEQIDRAAQIAINSNPSATVRQKQRAVEVAKAYKDVQIGNITIGELLTKDRDQDVLDSKLEFLEGEVPNPTLLQSTAMSFDKDYLKKSFKRDMAAVLVSFNAHGMFLIDLKEEHVIDELNNMVKYTAVYEDVNHKRHTIKYTLPVVDERGFCYVNGTYKVLKKQRVANPICKTSNSRVALSSNFNKFLVERNQAVAHSFLDYLISYLAKFKTRVTVKYGMHDYSNITVPYEYSSIASKFTSIVIDGYTFHFNYEHRLDDLSDKDKAVVTANESKFGVYMGTGEGSDFYLNLDGTLTETKKGDRTPVFNGTFITRISKILGDNPGVLTEWVDFKLLNKKIPLVFALAYRFGLTNMLQYVKAEYTLQDAGSRIGDRDPSDIIIRFKDKRLIIKRNPLLVSLIFAGLAAFDLSEVMFEEMDAKDVYYDLIQRKGLSVHNIKGIDDYFDFFMDPITADVLSQMKEPTNTKDLLIRATQLLTTEDHRPAASSTNFRFRSFERMNAELYNAMARGITTYRNKSLGSTNKFSINEYVVKQAVVQDQLMENVDITNPINDIKYGLEYSHVGFGGRTEAAFVVDDRKFTDDNLGIMAEAAPDNGKTGMAASISMNPTISNTRGMTISKPEKELDPSNLLSVTSLVYAGATNDDGKRASFINVQTSHVLPTKKSNVSRVRSGYEKVIAHRTRMPFAYSAEQDGRIEEIDEAIGMVKIRYKDGSIHCINYGVEYDKNGGGGFYTTQKITINNFKVGDKFNRGDIIVYNPDFFTKDPYSKQVDMNIGVLADIAFMESDGTIEDGSTIAKSLSDDLEINPCHVRTLTLTRDTTVHKFANIGTKVLSTDPIIIFDESVIPETMGNMDDEMISILGKLNRATPKAKFTGTIVQIDAYYKCKLEEMSPSIQKIVKLAGSLKNARYKFAKGTDSTNNYLPSTKVVGTDRLGTDVLDDEHVIFKFYIKQDMGMNAGDKIVFDSSLKSVCGGVVDHDIQVEDGSVQVKGLMSYRSINARIIMSPLLVGCATKVLERTEEQILDMYFGK